MPDKLFGDEVNAWGLSTFHRTDSLDSSSVRGGTVALDDGLWSTPPLCELNFPSKKTAYEFRAASAVVMGAMSSRFSGCLAGLFFGVCPALLASLPHCDYRPSARPPVS